MLNTERRVRLLMAVGIGLIALLAVVLAYTSTTTFAAAPSNAFSSPKDDSRPVSVPLAGTNTPTSTPTITRTPTLSRTPTRTATPSLTHTPFGCIINYTVTQFANPTMIPGSTLVTGSQCDECIATVNFPFSYNFYGQNFTSATLTANGQIVFSSPVDPSYYNFCVPDYYSNYSIFALWMDLTMDSSYVACSNYQSGCGIFTSVTGTSPNRVFAIEWRALSFAQQLPIDFEVLFYENQQRFDIIYNTMQPIYTDLATIGAQKDTGSVIVLITCPDDPNPISSNTGTTYLYGLSCPTATPTDVPVPSDTPTDVVTDTPTNTPSNTQTGMPVNTSSPTNTFIPTNTPTAASTSTYTPILTQTGTPTFTLTPTYTPTNTPTDVPTPLPSDTPTDTQTATVPPTDIPTDTPTDTQTATAAPTDTGTPTFTSTALPDAVTLVGHITLQNRGNPPSSRWVVPVNGSLVLAGGLAWLDYAATTDQSGYFTVTTDLPPGAYSWWVKNSQTLANGGNFAMLPGSNGVDLGILKAGDANDDNCVRVTDFNILKSSYGRAQGEPGYDARADFNGDGAIGIIDFNMMKPNFSSCGASSISLATPTATSTRTVTSTPTQTSTPVVATLVGHVTILGRPAQPNPRQSVPITLTLRLTTGGPDSNYTSMTDDSGFFTVTAPAPGIYNYRVKNPQALSNAGSVTLVGGTNQVEMGGLREGDANNDDCVRVTDFNILKSSYGRTQGEPGYDARADFNGDSVITIVDFNLLKPNFGSCGVGPIH